MARQVRNESTDITFPIGTGHNSLVHRPKRTGQQHVHVAWHEPGGRSASSAMPTGSWLASAGLLRHCKANHRLRRT
eukprot:10279169-Alexandrium_andersonii.AAC.1